MVFHNGHPQRIRMSDRRAAGDDPDQGLVIAHLLIFGTAEPEK
jgi:hypothetical protein